MLSQNSENNVKGRDMLVSIVVLTYNSALTIKDTLESIKKQTYKALELIITDDCSSDETVDICKSWLHNNGNRFINYEIVTSEQNTGVSANANRGVRKSSGSWVKTIAGDDLFFPNSIEKYVDSILKANCSICFAPLELFDGNQSEYPDTYRSLNEMYKVLQTNDRKIQYKTSLWKHILPGPGIFYTRQLFEDIGGFDENYPMSEEQAFEIKVLQKVAVFYINEPLVLWRQNANSLCHNPKSKTRLNDFDFFYKVRRKLLIKEFMFLKLIECWINVYIKKERYYNRNPKCLKYLFLLNPNVYINKVKQILHLY